MSAPNSKSILVSIYNHPNQYPPTANAIELLSHEFSKVFLTYRPNDPTPLSFAKNVFPSHWSKEETTSQSLPAKVIQFWKFTRQMIRVIKKEQPEVILVYDNLALYALHWTLKFCKTRAFLWYHNHDIPQLELIRKYSIGWFASKIDAQIFPKLHLFSVPTEERFHGFPIDLVKGKTEVIPNYPMLNKKQMPHARPSLENGVKFIFQGKITKDRGIEDSIRAFPQAIASGHNPYLSIMGPMDPAFEPELKQIITDTGMEERVNLLGWIPSYQKIAEITAQHHIGIAGIKPVGANYQSAGTASNKIYEYAASGLPIIFFDTPHYRDYLSPYQWAFASDFSPKSFTENLDKICADYARWSKAARKDFEDQLNYEHIFLPVLQQFNTGG